MTAPAWTGFGDGSTAAPTIPALVEPVTPGGAATDHPTGQQPVSASAPLTDEAAFDRAARYLKRALPTLERHAGRPLTADEVMFALLDRAQALRQQARKAARRAAR